MIGCRSCFDAAESARGTYSERVLDALAADATVTEALCIATQCVRGCPFAMCRKACKVPHCITFDTHKSICSMHLSKGAVERLTEREVVRSSCWSSIDLHDYYELAVPLDETPPVWVFPVVVAMAWVMKWEVLHCEA